MPDFLDADTSTIHALGSAQHQHADDLTAVAAELAAAQLPSGAYGSVGSSFLTALNEALRREARYAEHLADCLLAAKASTGAAAAAYDATEVRSGQTISTLGA